MIPKPSDIPNLDTTLTNNDIRGIMDALDPRYPWVPADQENGRAVGGASTLPSTEGSGMMG